MQRSPVAQRAAEAPRHHGEPTAWLRIGATLVAVAVVWNRPATRLLPLAVVALLYVALQLARVRWPAPRQRAGIAIEAAEGVAIGLGALASGGLESPLWLLLYPHAMAAAAGAGRRRALALALLDCAILIALALVLPGSSLGLLQGPVLLLCSSVVVAARAGSTRGPREAPGSRAAPLEPAPAAVLATGGAGRGVPADVPDSPGARWLDQERLAALNDIADAVNLNLTIEDIFTVVADEARRLVPFDLVTIALLQHDESQALELVSVGGGSDRERAGFTRLDVAWALERTVAWCESGGGPPPPRCRELLGEQDVVSLAVFPLRSKDRVIGSMNLGRYAAVPFSGEQQAILELVARHIAIALANARLLDALRRRGRELFELNGRLEELDRLRQDYLRNVSHEFRTPLTLIKGYAELLRDGDPPRGTSVREAMGVVVDSSNRLIDLVDTLLEIGRLEQAPAEEVLRLEGLDLCDVARSSLEPLRAAAAKKRIELVLDLPAEPLGLEADRGLLQQVVRKLVDNAVKYSPAGTRVVVRAMRVEEEVALEVEDFGIGIPPEHLARIFEKFYMVDGGVARQSGGAGVGLYLVRAIVRLHAGRVSVRSQPGQGSVFSVRLPRQPHAARREAALV
jgi:signal transduction histidine kinase